MLSWANCCMAFCILLACLSFSVSAYLTTRGEDAPCSYQFGDYTHTLMYNFEATTHRHDLRPMHFVDGSLGLLSVGKLDESTAFAQALSVP